MPPARTMVNALVVEPARMVAGLWRRRDLVGQFTRRAVEVRTRGSRLGHIWALITPLSMWAIYFFIFGLINNTRFGVLPGETQYDFSLALFLGLSLFHVFTETLSSAPGLIVSNPNFVKKVVFPLEILPVAQLGAALFHFGASLALLLAGMTFSTVGVTWSVLWLPVLLLPLVMFAMGVSWFLAALGVFLRDVGQITSFVATLLLFASAVMFPPGKIPAGFEWLRFNPLLQMVNTARGTLLWQEPIAWNWLAYNYAWGLAAFAIGAVFFSLLRKSFAEVL